MSRSVSFSTRTPRRHQTRLLQIIGLLVGASLAAGLIAAGTAAIDLKSRVVLLGAALLMISTMLVRDRPTFLLAVLVFGLQFLFYKAVGPLNLSIDGGAPGIYVSTAEVLLVVLYALWIRRGTFLDDVAVASRRREFVIPIIGLVAVVPSFLAAESIALAVAELVRAACGVALFVYVGAALKTRRELAWIVASLVGVAILQCLIVLLQWKTGSAAGMALLSQGGFGERVVAEGTVLRPSGTLFYPTVLGLVLAPIGLLCLSLAIRLPSRPSRAVALAGLLAATLPIVLAQARTALLAMAITGAGLVLYEVARGRLSWRALGASAAVVLIAGILFAGQIGRLVGDNVGTEHFWKEVEARSELNIAAFGIIHDAPLLGIGLNNYQLVMDRYQPYGVAFPGFPVHNLYLLTWAETGLLGLLGLLATFLALIRVNLRLAGARDPFLGAIGAALAAGVGVFILEALAGYTVRHVHATLVFWLLAGLSMAAERIGTEKPIFFRMVNGWPVPEPSRLGSTVLGSSRRDDDGVN